MKLKDMTKSERSLLLYLETCCVDSIGMMEGQRVNNDDFETMNRWRIMSFVFYGRIEIPEIKRVSKGRNHYTHWCMLSDNAWELAHEARREKAERKQYGTDKGE